MQFALMIYQGTTPLPNTDAWNALPQDEQSKIYADYAALNKTEGLTPGMPLGLPDSATMVKVVDGETVTTSGPYAGIDHAVGGYFVLEADDLDAAIAIAGRIPAARHGGGIEIRPAATYW